MVKSYSKGFVLVIGLYLGIMLGFRLTVRG